MPESEKRLLLEDGVKMRVVLVRHGQTNWNTEDKYRGRIDVKLNKRGVHEARLIGKKLSKIPVSGIYSRESFG